MSHFPCLKRVWCWITAEFPLYSLMGCKMESRSLPHPEHGLITDLGSSLFDLVQRGRYMHFQASAGHPKLPALQGDPSPANPELFRHHVAPDVLGKKQVSILSTSHHKYSFLDTMAGLWPTLPKSLPFHPALGLEHCESRPRVTVQRVSCLCHLNTPAEINSK